MKIPLSNPPFITAKNASELLGVSRQYIQYLIAQGKLTAKKTGEKRDSFQIDLESFNRFKSKRDRLQAIRNEP